MSFISLLFGLSLVSAPASDEFVFNNGFEPETLDPHRLTTLNDQQLATQLYDYLIIRGKDYYTLLPAAAERWEISRDFKTYTFTIRPRMKWSNGEAVTIEQIRNSFIRAFSPETNNTYSEWYSGVEGFEAFRAEKDLAKRKTLEAKLGIQIRGKNQLVFKLSKPSSTFIQRFTQPPFAIVHPSMYEAAALGWTKPEKFISSGPFILKEWAVNKQVVLEKNPYYYDFAKIKFKKIVAMAVGDESATYNLFKTGQLDWTGENTVSSSLVPGLRADPNFIAGPGFTTYAFLLNVQKKPLDDVRVRRALSLAIHRAEIVDKVTRAGQEPSSRFVPPIVGYKPSIIPPAPFQVQIDEAKRLLAEAGFPGGKGFPKLTMLYNTSEGHKKIAQAIQQMWKKYLGINIELENMEWKVVVEKINSKNYDIARQSWTGDIPDAGNMMELFRTTDGNNTTHWSNKEFDRLLNEASSMKLGTTRNKVLERAEKILLDQAPVIPIYHYVTYSLLSPQVKGFEHNLFGIYQLRFLTKK